MSYTDVFGSNTVPPSDAEYSVLTLTANTTLVWPYNASDTGDMLAKIMDIDCSAGIELTLPPANEVSKGEDFLLRNVGAETLTLKDNSGATIDTIASGISKYYFVTDNSTAAGVFGKVTYGAGASAATAGDLVGYGIKATSTSLNQAHPVATDADNITIDATFRAKTVVSTGGTCTVALGAAGTLGDDFFFLYHNAGAGTATLNPNGAETFDGAATFMVQPGESLIAVCSGTTWYSVGYGRSTLYQFTQLVKDVSAAGSFTLTAAEASNKLLSFTGNPASAVTIVVPNTVAIYYCQSTISTVQNITVKTAAGTGSVVTQSQRQILICDGTNVTTAQSATVTGSVSFDSGSAAAPSLNFTASTNTGLFLKGATGIGFSANGTEYFNIQTTGINVVATTFTTRGLTDSATATALTLSGSGANSVTIANSATNPTIGTSAGAISFNPVGQGEALRVTTGGASTVNYFSLSGAQTGGRLTLLATGSDTNVGASWQTKGSGSHLFVTETGISAQVAITHTASADRYITLTGSAGGNPTIGTSAGSLNLAPVAGFVQLNSAATAGLIINAATGNTALNALYVNNAEVARISAGASETLNIGTSSTATTQAAITHTAFAVNYLALTGAITTGSPTLYTNGTDTNINLNLAAKGTGAVRVITNYLTAGAEQVRVNHTASADRYITLTGSNGGNPTIGTSAGNLVLSAGGLIGADVAAPASAVNYITLSGSATSNAVNIRPNSTVDTNIGLTLDSKGNGSINFRTDPYGTPAVQAQVLHTASADRYITLTGGVSGSGTHATIGASSGRINSTSGFSISGGASTAADVSTNRVQFKNNSMLIVDSSRSADAKVVETIFGSGNFLIRYANDAYTDAASILAASGTSSRVTAVGLCYDTNDNPAVNIESVASQDRYITLTGSNGGNPTIGTSAGSLNLSSAVVCGSSLTVITNAFTTGYSQINFGTATPAGGAAQTGLFMGSAAIGVYFGSGAPTVSAAKGSLYLRSDGTTTNNRMYVNTDGGTTWTAVTTAA